LNRYHRSVRFTGVIYTFDVNIRWGGREVRNFRAVLNMCGEEAIDRLRLVLTMWDKTLQYRGSAQGRLEDLVGKASKERVSCEKFENTPASAWAIVEGLGEEKKVISLQKKVVDGGIDLRETSRCKCITHLFSV
ncbi:hypothetical protein EDC04DRAFT_2568775, partial [Pisolithus marmoratus]